MTETNSTITATENGGARDAILTSIRRSLATSEPFDAAWSEHHGHTADTTSTTRFELSCKELIENFRNNLELLGVHFALVSSETEAADHIRSVVEKLDAKRIVISDSVLVKRLIGISSAIEFVENAPAEFLFECDLGITSAQWAIAETGTLVLESEKESHRLTSLVPPVHLCILEASNIRQTLCEILELTSKSLSRTMTFITGASRTSDIELTLAIGVHGPGELHVIVIADQ
ncbi:MAG: lactate utilization protein [Acidobacteriota bacterium]